MKVLILLAIVAAAYAIDTPTVAKTDVPVSKTGREGRYVLLRDGSVFDTVVDRVITSNAQVVSQTGTLGNRDVFINTVPLRTYYSSPSIRYVVG